MMNNTALIFCVWKCCLNGFFNAGKTVGTDNHDIFYTTVLKVVKYTEPIFSTAYNSDNALKGLKIFADKGTLSKENTAPYEQDIALYKALNAEFNIPVIDNEYQSFRVSGVEYPDNKRITRAKTAITKPSSEGKDFYEFDPVIVIQEENIKDGKNWNHPDMSESLSYDGDYHGGEKASDYGLKNRMLFIVNNRTAKGKPVDVSQIKGGYGVYELPIDAAATASIGGKKKKVMVPDPKPLPEQLSMVYPLNENAEYVEISLSGDHRYLAIFSVRDGSYFVEVVDADNWKSVNTSRMFPASKKMTYTWGEDGTMAATDFENHVAILIKTESESKPYEMFYCGEIMTGFDEDMFTTEMVYKKNSRAAYEYGIDTGLAVTSTDDRVALVQNSPIESRNLGFRNADLECVVIDRTGVNYIGLMKSNLVDIDYGITEDEINAIEKLSDGSMTKNVIKPVGNENWAKWEK